MPGTAQAPEQRLPVHHYRRRSTVGPAWARAARILTRKGLEVRLPQPASAGSSQLRPGGQVDDQGLEIGPICGSAAPLARDWRRPGLSGQSRPATQVTAGLQVASAASFLMPRLPSTEHPDSLAGMLATCGPASAVLRWLRIFPRIMGGLGRPHRA